MWNTPHGLRTLKGPEAVLFRNMVAFMLDPIREQLGDSGKEEPISAGVAVFDALTLAQQVAVLAEVVPPLLDDKIPSPPIQAELPHEWWARRTQSIMLSEGAHHGKKEVHPGIQTLGRAVG